MLGSLSDRERTVIEMRFGFEGGHLFTLEQIGARYGVTRERIRQIETQTLKKLRHPSRSGSLQQFLH